MARDRTRDQTRTRRLPTPPSTPSGKQLASIVDCNVTGSNTKGKIVYGDGQVKFSGTAVLVNNNLPPSTVILEIRVPTTVIASKKVSVDPGGSSNKQTFHISGTAPDPANGDPLPPSGHANVAMALVDPSNDADIQVLRCGQVNVIKPTPQKGGGSQPPSQGYAQSDAAIVGGGAALGFALGVLAKAFK